MGTECHLPVLLFARFVTSEMNMENYSSRWRCRTNNCLFCIEPTVYLICGMLVGWSQDGEINTARVVRPCRENRAHEGEWGPYVTP